MQPLSRVPSVPDVPSVPVAPNPHRAPAAAPRRWDVFCSLFDNLGDVGVSWRLAVALAQRGEQVRLFLDDRKPLAFMAPNGAAGVELCEWPVDAEPSQAAAPQPGDVVIETFGCHLPDGFVSAMAQAARPPVWINLEYLSAEGYAQRSHALPSPQHNGLPKWFFFPGFVPGTGGVIREVGLLERRAAFQRDAWLAGLRIQRQTHERVALLFCYANPALAATLQALASQPTLLLLTPGHAEQQVSALHAAGALPASLRLARLPWLSQMDFDHALWCSDINFVRGEDSWVRAIWAGAPFVWQLYPQEAEVREVKLAAWLHCFSGGSSMEPSLLGLHRRYNGLDGLDGPPPTSPVSLPDAAAWQQATRDFRERLALQNDLVSQLQAFVAGAVRAQG